MFIMSTRLCRFPSLQKFNVGCVDGSEWRDSCNQLCSCVKGHPRCCRERKDFESMTVEERRLYVDTVITASTRLPYKRHYQSLLVKHKQLFDSGIHRDKSLFLPWHRWFLLEYENLLRGINCNVTVPYWDWSLWAIRPFDAPLWGSEAHQIGGNGTWTESQSCVKDGKFGGDSWSLPDGSCLQRQFETAAFPGPVEVRMVLEHGPSEFDQFEEELRLNLHGTVHCLIGGTMCSKESAYAPEFFLHHGFIDKLWNDWQKESSAHHNAQFSSLTNPMVGTGVTSVADVIDNQILPGGVRVCYSDPTNDDLEEVVTLLKSLSIADLRRIRRPPFAALSIKALNLFGVSSHDRAIAVAADKDLRSGCVGSGNPFVVRRLKWNPLLSTKKNLQISRLGFTPDNVVTAKV